MNTEDLSHISQRFTLPSLYISHTAYVSHLRLKNITPQTAGNTVNQIPTNSFSMRQGKQFSIQTVKNQVKHGSHWHDFHYHSKQLKIVYCKRLEPAHGTPGLTNLRTGTEWNPAIET